VQVGPPPQERPLNFQFEVGKTKAPVKDARERTEPVIGMENAANAKKAVTPQPLCPHLETPSALSLVLHSALGDYLK
jgi:hypothetical protein